jgi:hypothetical protein
VSPVTGHLAGQLASSCFLWGLRRGNIPSIRADNLLKFKEGGGLSRFSDIRGVSTFCGMEIGWLRLGGWTSDPLVGMVGSGVCGSLTTAITINHSGMRIITRALGEETLKQYPGYSLALPCPASLAKTATAAPTSPES